LVDFCASNTSFSEPWIEAVDMDGSYIRTFGPKLVSHRFSTVRMADVILVVADGRVAEAGNHNALMQQGGL